MEDTTAMTLGKRILYYRKRMGMTQDQLAERMGVTAQVVSKWEHDLSCPDVTALPRLAEIFGITTDELLGITGAQPQLPERREERTQQQEKEPWHWEFHMEKEGIFFGLFLVLAGGIYLAATLLKLTVGFWQILWPTALLLLGVKSCADRFNAFGVGAVLAGGYFLLEHLGLIPSILSWPLALGVLLILWGLSVVFDQFGHRRYRTASGERKAYTEKDRHPTRDFHTDDGYIQADFAFCSDRVTVQDSPFRGGDVDIAFGTLVLDLRSCTGAAEGCCLKVDVSFGSMVLLLPKSLRLVTHDMDRTGSSMDITGEPNPDAQPVVLRGDCAFSSLKIQYD